jgi:PAS domain S-box-containing protein
MNIFQQLFSPDFMPHGYCYMWDPRIVWLHVISDGLIAVAYYCIPIILIYFIRKNRSLPFNKIFWMFGVFILACGTTHVMEIWNIWHTTYFVAGLLKAGTAAVSVLTAAMLIPLVPKAMLLPSLVRSQEQNMTRRLRAETALQENLIATEKARAELADSQQLLRLLLDGIEDYAIHTLDTSGNVTSWNAGAARIGGYSEAEILGTHFSCFYTPVDRAAGKPSHHLQQSLLLGRYEEQGQRIRKDGSSYWADVVISPIYDNLGKHKGFTKIARDVTERKVATDEALRGQAEILNLAQVMVRNTEGRIEVWSGGSEKLYGYTREEAVGRISHELLQTQFPGPLEQIEERLEHDGTWEGELVHRARDGRSVIVATAWVLHRVGHGKPSLVVESNADITVLKQTEQRLAKKTQELISMQQSLEAQTQDLQTVLDSMTEGLATVDAEGRFVIWNAGAAKLLGLEVTDLPAEAWAGHYGFFMNDTVTPFPADEMPVLRALRGEVTRTEMFVRNERIPKGIYIEVYGNPMFNKAGAICGGVAAFRDITQLKEDERQIRNLNDNLEQRVAERTAQLKTATAELSDRQFALDQHAIVAITDLRGTISYVNDKFCTISKYSREELMGQNHRILNSGYHPKEFFHEMYGTIARGKVWRAEIRNRAKDGSIYWVDTTIVPTLGAEGKPRQYVAIRADITDRKRTEDALKESLARSEVASRELAIQKFALDQHAIVAMTDVQGTITYVNEKFCEISQYSKDELLGKNHRILNSGHHPKSFFQEMYGIIARGNVWRAEIRNRAKDGSIYWVDTTIVPTLDVKGKPCQYVAIRADVTERKRAEENLAMLHREMEARNLKLEEKTMELQRTRDELEFRVVMRTEDLAKTNRTLESSNIELQQFAYVASHDLQSPLRSISGFVQLLKMDYEEKLDDQARDYIRRTVQSIAQMQTLIHDLLSYSRVESRSRPFVTVSLLDVFHGSVSLLETSIRDAGGQVTCGELPVVLGDGSQLAQLMQNLISNGLKYHGTEPPHVHVSAKPGTKKNEWIVSVRDNGIGIDPKYFGRIFEIFKRLHDQKEYPGTGIGLAVCRRVVERHGGSIWVESEPGHGSSFRFSIPADAAKSTGKTERSDETNDQHTFEHEAG